MPVVAAPVSFEAEVGSDAAVEPSRQPRSRRNRRTGRGRNVEEGVAAAALLAIEDRASARFKRSGDVLAVPRGSLCGRRRATAGQQEQRRGRQEAPGPEGDADQRGRTCRSSAIKPRSTGR
jgi:hypothetical protein